MKTSFVIRLHYKNSHYPIDIEFNDDKPSVDRLAQIIEDSTQKTMIFNINHWKNGEIRHTIKPLEINHIEVFRKIEDI